MAKDDIRDREIVTPAVNAAPAATVVVDGLPPTESDSEGSTSTLPESPLAADALGAAPPSPRRRFTQFVPRMSGKLVAGLVLVIGTLLFAFLGPLFTQNPRNSGNPALLPPGSDGHILGTTSLGRDVLAQLAHGAQGSIMVGLVAGAIALVLSLIFGILAGYIGGWTDEGLSAVTSVMLVLPGLPLVIVLASFAQQSDALEFMSRSLWLVAIILGLTAWPGAAIVLRSQARSLRVRDYVAASRVAGEKPYRIIGVEILPNLLPLLAAQFIGAVILAIMNEAGLAYLGLGPSGSITWGTMLNEAQTGAALTRGAWWWFVPPGLMIALFGCGLSLINFSIDEVVNPKLRNAPAAVKSVRKAAKAVEREGEAGAAVAPARESGDSDAEPEKKKVDA